MKNMGGFSKEKKLHQELGCMQKLIIKQDYHKTLGQFSQGSNDSQNSHLWNLVHLD